MKKIKVEKDELILFFNLLAGSLLSAAFELWVVHLHWKSVLVIRLLTIILNGVVALWYGEVRIFMRKFSKIWKFSNYKLSNYIREFLVFFVIFTSAYLLKLVVVVVLHLLFSDLFPLSFQSILDAILFVMIGTFSFSLIYRSTLAWFYKYKKKKTFIKNSLSE